MNEEEQWELKQDRLEEARKEDFEEKLMGKDIDFCYSQCGLDELHIEVLELVIRMNSNGWQIDYDDVIEELGDL